VSDATRIGLSALQVVCLGVQVFFLWYQLRRAAESERAIRKLADPNVLAAELARIEAAAHEAIEAARRRRSGGGP
jgi:type VI protein secretion system component VasK